MSSLKWGTALLFPLSPSFFVSSQRTLSPVSGMPGGQVCRRDRKRLGALLFLVLISPLAPQATQFGNKLQSLIDFSMEMWHYQGTVHSSGCLSEAKTGARKGSLTHGVTLGLGGGRVCIIICSPSWEVGESSIPPPGHIFVSPPFPWHAPKHCSPAIFWCGTNLNLFENILFQDGSKWVLEQLWF